jgi:hypothetical protein
MADNSEPWTARRWQCENGDSISAARLQWAADHQRDLIGYVRSALASDELAPALVDIQTVLPLAPFEEAVAQGRAARSSW